MKWNGKNDRKWLCILLIMIGYCFFLLLKIAGYFDYTSKFGIESIYCSQIYDNSLMIIDHDSDTTWGITEKHEKDEQFLISFRKNRKIEKVSVFNALYDIYPTKEIDIWGSPDGEKWFHCDHIIEAGKKGVTGYTFQQVYDVRYLLLVYQEEQADYWPISEIYIE